jgi:hypothetical protein
VTGAARLRRLLLRRLPLCRLLLRSTLRSLLCRGLLLLSCALRRGLLLRRCLPLGRGLLRGLLLRRTLRRRPPLDRLLLLLLLLLLDSMRRSGLLCDQRFVRTGLTGTSVAAGTNLSMLNAVVENDLQRRS